MAIGGYARPLSEISILIPLERVLNLWTDDYYRVKIFLWDKVTADQNWAIYVKIGAFYMEILNKVRVIT